MRTRRRVREETAGALWCVVLWAGLVRVTGAVAHATNRGTACRLAIRSTAARPGIPEGAPDAKGLESPTVLRDPQGRLVMWYRGQGFDDDEGRILRAVSFRIVAQGRCPPLVTFPPVRPAA